MTNHAWTVSIDGDGKPRKRMTTGIPGVDRVLGGGFVPGSTVLLTGQKGVGVTTLALQIQGALSPRFRTLHATGEEREAQIGERAKRLGIPMDGRVIHTRNLSDAIGEVARLEGIGEGPDLIVADSLRTICVLEASHDPAGRVVQALSITSRLNVLAKNTGHVVLLLDQDPADLDEMHAGSQQVRHLVDVVLTLTTDGGLWTLTDPKNRYGFSDVSATFEMTPTGLREIVP